MAVVSATPTIPGPRPFPILGTRANLTGFFRDPVGYMTAIHRRYGLVASFPGQQDAVFAFGPEYSHQILSDQDRFHNSKFVLFPAPPDSAAQRLDQGLIMLNGAYHRRQRRLVLPAFHRKAIDRYRDDMVRLTDQTLSGWRSGDRVDVAQQMQRLTLRIASQTLLGVDASAGADRIGGLINRWLQGLFSPGVLVFPINLPGTPYRRQLAIAERLETAFRTIIAHKRAATTPQHDVLGMLLEARDDQGAPLSDAELIGQAHVFFTAGHETSANALTWTLFLLAQHPHILHDLTDELTGVLGGGDAPTLEQLGRLPLLERVIKESMRLLPPAVSALRVSTEPFELGPYSLPANTMIILGHYVTHRLPELYERPHHFLPARWEQIDPSPYEYLPFGAGPRMCIGSTFAMMELKIVLAMILQRFRLTVVPHARIDRHVKVTLSPLHGMPMQVAKQDRRFHWTPVHGNILEMVRFS